MNIDMTFDYDRLLVQAQDEYAKVLESGAALPFDPDAPGNYLTAVQQVFDGMENVLI